MMSEITTAAAVELLTDLVGCPSVNPGTEVVGGPPFGEQRLAELVAGKIEAMGGAAEVVAVPRPVAVVDGHAP